MNKRAPVITALLFGTLLGLGGCAAPLLVGGAAAGGALLAHDRRGADVVVDDQSAELELLEHIARDAKLSDESHINTICYNGVMLLVGEIPDINAHRKVEVMARQTQHVSKVINELMVGEVSDSASRRKDSWITTKIKSELLLNEKVAGDQVKVVTERQTVYLMGLLTREEAAVATEVARKVKGVKKVIRAFEYVKIVPAEQAI